MAFDSTVGGSSANAYVPVSFCDTYHSDRGHSDWKGSSGQKQQAIVRATDYVDKRFGRRFRGERENKDQALEWPRLNAFDNDNFLLEGTTDEIPRQLQKAVAEYALRALALIKGTDADLVPDDASTTGQVTSESVTVGPITESKTYAGAGSSRSLQSGIVSDDGIPEYPAADLWIEELLRSGLTRRLARS